MDGSDHHPAAPLLAPTVAALGADLKVVLERLRGEGFRCVQLSATQEGMRPRDLDRSARRDLLAAMRRRELTASGVDAWIPPRHFVDPATVDRAVAALNDAIALAADLGRCPVSTTFPGDAPAFEPVLEAIRSHAERLGVPVADHALEVREDPIVGVGIDPAASLADGADPAAAVVRHSARLVAVRLCDLLATGLRGPIGTAGQSRLDVTAYRAAIDVSAFDRPVVLDARQWADPWRGVAATRTVWEGDLLRRA